MKKGDVPTFIRTERQKLIAYVRSLLAGPTQVDAEDLVHDVLASVLERSDRLSPDYLAAYVYRSLRNRVIDQGRTRKPALSIDSEGDNVSIIEVLTSLESDPMLALQRSQSRERLFEAMEQLSEMERKVLIAHEFEGTPFKELSQSWEIPQNTLLSHKSRAIGKLKKLLTEKEGEA